MLIGDECSEKRSDRELAQKRRETPADGENKTFGGSQQSESVPVT